MSVGRKCIGTYDDAKMSQQAQRSSLIGDHVDRFGQLSCDGLIWAFTLPLPPSYAWVPFCLTHLPPKLVHFNTQHKLSRKIPDAKFLSDNR